MQNARITLSRHDRALKRNLVLKCYILDGNLTCAQKKIVKQYN